LEILFLEDNDLGLYGALCLSNNLHNIPYLLKLYLMNNNFTNDCAKPLGVLLKDLKELECLRLDSNFIGNKGFETIV
jgi:hypothetical protein